jgi:Transcriptional regulator containing an amidase domain and an AraC-type DNA-binding HTH domain
MGGLRWYDLFHQRFPTVEVMRGPRFVEDGKFATSGGLTAGVDLALRTVDRVFGREVAQKTADGLEYVSTGWRV